MGSRKKKRQPEKRKRGRPKKTRPIPQGLPPGATVIVSPRGELKMSEVLLAFAEPYLETCPNDDAFKRLLSVAVMAWNAALYSGKQRADFVHQMVETVPPDIRADMRAIVEEMILRKETQFAHIKR